MTAPGGLAQQLEDGPGPRTEIWTHGDKLDEHAIAVDDLLDSVEAPVTARRRWWTAWLQAFPDATPWMVARFGRADDLLALAPLARRERTGYTQVLGIGDDVSDYARLPARSDRDAIVLADFIADHLDSLHRPWSLSLRQLPPGDPVAGSLAARLRHARPLDGRSAPRTAISERSISNYVSKNYRKAARNRFNRLERAGHQPRVSFLRTRAEIDAVLAEVIDICRVREHEMVGRSHLDDPRRERFFRTIALSLADEGKLELGVLRADGQIVSYQMNLMDDGVYRTWNGHHHPAWAEYSPGHVLDYHTMDRIVSDPAYEQIDWMAGLEEYKFRAATHTVATEDLLAWSSPLVAAIAFGPRLTRERLEMAAEQDERAARALELLRRGRDRVHRTMP